MRRWYGLLLALALSGCSFNFDRQTARDLQPFDQHAAEAGPVDAPAIDRPAASDARQEGAKPDSATGKLHPVWARGFGGGISLNGGDWGSALGIAADHLYLAGRWDTGGNRYIFVGSYNLMGSSFDQTANPVSGGPETEGSALVVKTNDLYVTGSFQTALQYAPNTKYTAGHATGPALFVSRFFADKVAYAGSIVDTSTECTWSTGRGVASDAQGNVYVTGSFAGALGLGPQCTVKASGGRDLFVAKLDASLTCSWVKAFGGPGNDEGSAISVDGSSIYVAGSVGDGDVPFAAPCAKKTHQTGGDILVARLDLDGNCQAADVVGQGPWGDAAQALALDSKGQVLVAGYFRGKGIFGGSTLSSMTDSAGSATQDAFVACWTPSSGSGSWKWATRIGGEGSDAGNGLAVGSGEATYVTGRVEGAGTITAAPSGRQGMVPAPGKAGDVMVVALDVDGQPLWATAYGGPGLDEGRAIAVRGGEVYVTGRFSDSFSLGKDFLKSGGGTDLFLLELAP